MSTDDAFAEAYRAHYWAVSRFVARRLDGQAHEVEEVVAEVFSIAWRRRTDLPDAPLPWLYGVARNCLANTVRGLGRYRRLLHRLGNHEAAHQRQTVESPDAERPGSWVHEALARLSPADREVLRLTAWEELTVEELAVTLGCGRSAAAMRLHRARGRLRTQIERMRQRGAARPDAPPSRLDAPPAQQPSPPAQPPSPPAQPPSPAAQVPAPATPPRVTHHPVPTRAGGRRHD
ncbi:RNA polymerase sigma-70 factor, ECF subfamily [Streptomyces sp. 2224.1]|uniref:RNA polymerase sigma factor n=1 Tax=unclassified Streptomyces TaxID=2593676 RepID=UPI000880C662|nr:MULTISPECIES: sigma-70 family RNA polymerase sigma factor [unclassified Streptomyces]PBC82158.1 RNA polymerase sigma-70 factor (ECF subfamily) [Streptomyces sp. 2321.6]SDR51163.1 RNA polymerase sigma-70 factor, ECF subfamily [Streptomyces sp. KS_16]SEC45953.1 RNA polymerase sigma-70 factor, ECF subfamily [Streptomyces sp. 2133.1]SEC57952.1 RNA polymerase sigma-70 factor, ECF subfamily [Streptomyces sp. 2224.1]SEF01138.1 RNA polymerase sigma-70 factor, ECF subfamily [Streptomyces sp. 2112.3]